MSLTAAATAAATSAHLPPAVALHLGFALPALVLGPLALWARKGTRLHRTAGYAWLICMLGTALSAFWLRDGRLPNIGGYTPIHLLAVLTLTGIVVGIWHVVNGRIPQHRRTMQRLFGGLVVAGVFTLLPNRLLGQWLWHQTLGWM